MLRPPGRIYFALLVLASTPAIVGCWVMPPFSSAVLKVMFWAHNLLWLGLAGYGLAAAVYALLFDRRELFCSGSVWPRGRWIVPPIVFVLTLGLAGTLARFNVAFPMSRTELDAFVAARETVGRRVGEMDIGDVEYLPTGEVKLHTYVGFHFLDAQGLLFNPKWNATPPGRDPPSLDVNHIAGPWYRFCDG